MEPKFQTSFIPKRPIGSTASSSSGVVRSTNILSILATIVFIITALTSLGLFFYKQALTGQIEQNDKDIASVSTALEPQKIQDLIDANSRISTTKILLEDHVVLSKLLLLLNDLTLKKMRLTELIYKNQNDISSLSLTGELQTYNALAEEQNIFSKNEFIKNPVFSNFVLGDNGYITVDFRAMIDPNLVSYKKYVENSIAQ